MTREEANRLIEKVLETNPKGNAHLVGGLEASKPKPNTPQALVGGGKELKEGQEGLAYCVLLIACMGRALDSDNLVGSLKPLRDAIASSLGLDDADERITWEYGQVLTKGKQCVMVKIDVL